MDAGALKRSKATFSIDLHPSHSASALTGIREQLNTWLLRWNHDLGGIMLSYTNIRLLSSQARIHPYFPFFHVDITADVDLFCPGPGHTLSGRVSKIGADYVGLLVLGVFNAAIGRQNIRSDLLYQPLANCWASQKHPEHVIEEGSEVIFTVHIVQNEGDFFSLTGKLLSRSTGTKSYVGAVPVDEHRKAKKRRAEGLFPGSIAQLEGAPLQQSASKEHHQQTADMHHELPAAERPQASNKRQPGDSSAGLPGGLSLTERQPKKRRRTEDAMQSTQAAGTPDAAGAADTAQPEPGHHTSSQALVAAPAVDVPIKLEPGVAQGKLSRKQLKKLGLSAPDPAAATTSPASTALKADLQRPDHSASAPMHSADLAGLSKEQRKALRKRARDSAVATPLHVKAEAGADGANLQPPEQPASAPTRGADLPGLSKKQRKKLRMSMPDAAVLSRMSSDTGVGLHSDSMQRHPQENPRNVSAGQDIAVVGNGASVKKEEGTSSEKKSRQNEHASAVGQVKREPILSNGHNVNGPASLHGSSRKKHKKRSKVELLSD